jgi:hypothetical protein
MNTIQELLDKLTFVSEIIAASVAVAYYPKIKNSYWKWFVLYLVFILFESIILKYISKETRMYFYDFLVVPIEFFFFFWLYAQKSLKNNKIFWLCIIIFMASFVPHLFYTENYKSINEVSYIVGCLLLFALVLLELYKQIITDDILLFNQNKMFYINVGVVLFYIGSLPLLAFMNYLFSEENEIFNYYYTYFLFSGNLMYLLFAASFVWGKPQK